MPARGAPSRSTGARRRRSAAGAVALGLSCVASNAATAGADVWLGAGVGVSEDLVDGASGEHTRLGVGPSLFVPLRVGLTPWMRLRLDLRLEVGFGVDQLTWNEEIDGVQVRRTDADTHRAFVGALGGELGVEARIPTGAKVEPYVGAGVGVVGVGAYHALSEDTAVLLDPDQNRLGEPGNLDPYTVQASVSYSLAAGAAWRARDAVDLWVEIGYGGAFLPSQSLRKAPVELDARREAFAWNPFRVAVGVLFKL
jgi:hypothetical protein